MDEASAGWRQIDQLQCTLNQLSPADANIKLIEILLLIQFLLLNSILGCNHNPYFFLFFFFSFFLFRFLWYNSNNLVFLYFKVSFQKYKTIFCQIFWIWCLETFNIWTTVFSYFFHILCLPKANLLWEKMNEKGKSYQICLNRTNCVWRTVHSCIQVNWHKQNI